MRALRIAIILLGLLQLSGCGFALRGSQELQLPASLTLQPAEAGSAFARLLQDTLAIAGAELVESGPILAVGPEQHSIRPISVTGRASAAQYELTSSVEIMVTDPAGEVLLPREMLAVHKTYYEDISNIAGSDDEIALLRTEMRHELSQQVVRRLQALANGTRS